MHLFLAVFKFCARAAHVDAAHTAAPPISAVRRNFKSQHTQIQLRHFRDFKSIQEKDFLKLWDINKTQEPSFKNKLHIETLTWHVCSAATTSALNNVSHENIDSPPHEAPQALWMIRIVNFLLDPDKIIPVAEHVSVGSHLFIF